MRVRVLSVLSSAALALIFAASASEMRADVLFSNFGPSQTYVGNSWWNVGSTSLGTQDIAFSFTPTTTGALTGADLALASASTGIAPLTVFIESSSGGAPGAVLDTLTQVGAFPGYPATSVVNFTCSGSCVTLDAGTTYWIVGQETNSADEADWLYSFSDTGTWFYNETGSSTGPWTTATAGNTFSAFDVTGTPSTTPPVPEPGSLALLGSGLVGVLAAARRKLQRS